MEDIQELNKKTMESLGLPEKDIQLPSYEELEEKFDCLYSKGVFEDISDVIARRSAFIKGYLVAINLHSGYLTLIMWAFFYYVTFICNSRI